MMQLRNNNMGNVHAKKQEEVDINCNSPRHQGPNDSSLINLDGSYIQDDGDMQLMQLAPDSAIYDDDLTMAQRHCDVMLNFNRTNTSNTPQSILTQSWIQREHQKWACDYDANIAELEFENDIDLGFESSPTRNPPKPDQYQSTPLDVRDINVDIAAHTRANFGARQLQLASEEMMRQSLEMSDAESLFSSMAIDGNPATIEELASRVQVSTDSLDLSQMIDPERLQKVCAANAKDYCLTFSKMSESGLLPHSRFGPSSKPTDYYKDAPLSTALEELRVAEQRSRDSSSPPGGQEDNLVTWGRLRRSCEENFVNGNPNQSSAPKSFSMPMLGFNTGFYNHLIGAGEQMTSELTSSPLPVYSLTASVHARQQEPISLLEVFKQRQKEQRELESSGYHTGETTTKRDSWLDNDGNMTLDQPTTSARNDSPDYQPTPTRVGDYNYVEFYDEGRYIDCNQNEIGFTPATTSGVQSVTPPSTSRTGSDIATQNRWQDLQGQEHTPRTIRTFANLLQRRRSSAEGQAIVPLGRSVDQAVQTSPRRSPDRKAASATQVELVTQKLPRSHSATPNLDFMRLSHQVPSLFPAAPPFPIEFLTNSPVPPPSVPPNDRAGIEALLAPARLLDVNMAALMSAEDSQRTHDAIMSGNMDDLIKALPSLDGGGAFDNQSTSAPALTALTAIMSRTSSNVAPSPSFASVPRERDSGLGASGPAHIQDWESLATLLPRDVVNACSFFKNNQQLLSQPSLGVDKQSPRQQHYRHRRRHMIPSRFDSIQEQEVDDVNVSDFKPAMTTSVPCHGLHGMVSKPVTHHTHTHHHHHYRVKPTCCCSNESSEVRGNIALRRWHKEADSESEWSSENDTPTTSTAAPMTPATLQQQSPRRTCARKFTESEDSNARAKFLPDAMYSEYQLRERDARVRLRQYLSLYEMESQLTGSGSDDFVTAGWRPCATCYRVRSPRKEELCPPLWAQPLNARHWFCDCLDDGDASMAPNNLYQTTQRIQRKRRKVPLLCGEEISLRHTEVYEHKRHLIERVVLVCDRLMTLFARARLHSDLSESPIINAVHSDLCPAVVRVLRDGLLPGFSLWQAVVVKSSTFGPATRCVHALVEELDVTNLSDNEKMHDFLVGLLRLRSLDCWLSYVSLKDAVLDATYQQSALLRRATTGYRSQFERMIVALQPLSLVPIHKTSLGAKMVPFKPTRLPSDSRVPKSSSIPEKLCEQAPPSPVNRPVTLEKNESLTIHVESNIHSPKVATPQLLTPNSMSSKIPVLKASTSNQSIRSSSSSREKSATPVRRIDASPLVPPKGSRIPALALRRSPMKK